MTFIKKLIATLWLASVIAAFAPEAAAQSTQHAWNCFPEATLTNDVYWQAQPPAVRALRNMPSGKDRDVLATNLAVQGYIIDVPIMAFNWDPVCTMGVRLQQGYTWVPSALQPPVLLAPGLSFPGIPAYDAKNPPAGSIKVSVDAKDYPSADPPPPPKPVVNASVVGVCYPGGAVAKVVCSTGPGIDIRAVTDGQQFARDGVTYKAHVSQGLFGRTVWLEPQN